MKNCLACSVVMLFFLLTVTTANATESITNVTIPGQILESPAAGNATILDEFGTAANSYFSIHSHVYISDFVPNPDYAIVTYSFSGSVIVSALQVEEHQNGITEVEGYVGNSPDSMTSIGSVSTSLPLSERMVITFDFDSNTIAGTIFQFVIKKTSLKDGFAAYAIHPIFQDATPVSAVPVPSTMLLLGTGLVSLTALSRRRKSN